MRSRGFSVIGISFLSIWFALACLSGSPAIAATDWMTITLTSQEYPPLTMVDPQASGLLTEIVRESFKLSHVKAEFVGVPNNRAITGLLRGMYEGSYGWAHSPERDVKLLYSTKPIYALRVVFFQKNVTEITWSTLQELSRYNIGVTLGNYYSAEFDTLVSAGKLTTDPASSDVINFKKLLFDRIQLFPIDQDVGQYLLKKYFTKEEQQQIIFQRKAITVIPVYLVVRRDLHHARELVDRFDQGYQQLSNSGQLDKLIEVYKSQISDKPQ